MFLMSVATYLFLMLDIIVLLSIRDDARRRLLGLGGRPLPYLGFFLSVCLARLLEIAVAVVMPLTLAVEIGVIVLVAIVGEQGAAIVIAAKLDSVRVRLVHQATKGVPPELSRCLVGELDRLHLVRRLLQRGHSWVKTRISRSPALERDQSIKEFELSFGTRPRVELAQRERLLLTLSREPAYSPSAHIPAPSTAAESMPGAGACCQASS